MRTFSDKEKVQLLADMIEIQTENDNEINVCQYLQNLLSKYEIDSKILKVNDSRANLVADIGNGSPVLAMSGHMDVVNASDKNQWTYPPFKLTEHDGKLYGRGTTDMKGGLMAMVISIIELKEDHDLPNGTIRLLATTGEEKEQHGAKQLADKSYLDDVDGLIIGEPTDNAIFNAHKGSMACKVTATGKAAHSSMPFLGINAIDILIDFINRINTKYNDIKKHDTEHQLNISPMLKKFNGDSIGEEKENDASGLTMIGSIINGGNQFNSVPDKATIEYNVRPVPEYDNDFVKQLFENTIQEVDKEHLKLEIPSNHRPVFSDENNSLIQCITKYAPHYIDKDSMIISALIGTTDASSLLGDNHNNVDLAIFGPGKTIMAHQIDEYIEKDQYLNYVDIYKEVCVNYLNNEK